MKENATLVWVPCGNVWVTCEGYDKKHNHDRRIVAHFNTSSLCSKLSGGRGLFMPVLRLLFSQNQVSALNNPVKTKFKVVLGTQYRKLPNVNPGSLHFL